MTYRIRPYAKYGHHHYEVEDSNGKHVATFDHHTLKEVERFVAAWNACEGISTEDLEDGVIEKLPDYVRIALLPKENLGRQLITRRKALRIVEPALAKLKDTPND